jgi:hypothetical protein
LELAPVRPRGRPTRGNEGTGDLIDALAVELRCAPATLRRIRSTVYFWGEPIDEKVARATFTAECYMHTVSAQWTREIAAAFLVDHVPEGSEGRLIGWGEIKPAVGERLGTRPRRGTSGTTPESVDDGDDDHPDADGADRDAELDDREDLADGRPVGSGSRTGRSSRTRSGVLRLGISQIRAELHELEKAARSAPDIPPDKQRELARKIDEAFNLADAYCAARK